MRWIISTRLSRLAWPFARRRNIADIGADDRSVAKAGGFDMTWIDQIVEVTGWRGEPVEYGWDREEAELGVRLPSDFKELTRRFPAGAFYAYLNLMRQEGEPDSHHLLVWHRSSLSVASDPQHQPDRLHEPYGLFQPGGRAGLIRWGMDQREGEYYWLADREVDPDSWPVLARTEALAEEWERFDMTASEVVYRVIADPEFKPLTVVDPPRRPFYLPAGQDLSVEGDALTAPDRDT